jgi:hypothetical protein
MPSAAWAAATIIIAAVGLARAGDVTVVGSTRSGQWSARTEPVARVAQHSPATGTEVFESSADGESVGTALAEDVRNEGNVIEAEDIECRSRWLSFASRSLETNWYTRFDYFFWKEVQNSEQLLDENGVLYNLGYVRTAGAQRLRGELFTGAVHYGGTTWDGDPVDSKTSYLGCRAEYEWIWDLNFRGCPPASMFLGVGTRFWIRDIKDGTILPDNGYANGYQETWWTFYPYLGLEKRWVTGPCEELFVSGRVGATAYTYEFASLAGAPTINPSPSVTGQVECGWRDGRLYIAAQFEAMTWNASPIDRGFQQPCLQMYTTGLKLGLTY